MSEPSPQLYIYIRFVQGGGWDSRVIEYFSRWWTSHVEFIAYSGSTFGAQFKGGVCWRSSQNPCYAKMRRMETWRIPVTAEQYELFEKLCDDAVGTKYDWPAIFSFALGQHRLHLRGAYICSGFVAGVLKSLGLAAILRPIENYDPQHIYDIVPQLPGAVKL